MYNSVYKQAICLSRVMFVCIAARGPQLNLRHKTARAISFAIIVSTAYVISLVFSCSIRAPVDTMLLNIECAKQMFYNKKNLFIR